MRDTQVGVKVFSREVVEQVLPLLLVKQFAFDSRPRTYQVYKPKETTSSWVAQVKGAGVKGFTIRPNFDMEHPLYSPAGGYVVKGDHNPEPDPAELYTDVVQ